MMKIKFFCLVSSFLIVLISTGQALAVDSNNIIESLHQNKELNYVFDINSLPTITLEFSTKEWNKQLIFFDQNPRHEEMVKANFIFEKNGKIDRVKNVGIRIKGNRFSRIRPEGIVGKFHDPVAPVWHKAHFSINFKKYKKKRRFRGFRGLSLRFIKDDPTYVRELYGYDLAKRFGIWTMHFASFAKLFIKIKEDPEPVYFGIYTMTEKIGKGYLERRFGNQNSKGYLWKNLWIKRGLPANLTTESFGSEAVGVEDISLNEHDSYRPTYDLKTNKAGFEKGKAQFHQFIWDLNSKKGDEFTRWIQSAMDVDLFLKVLAVNVLLGRWDTYWVSANNYYLYFDVAGKAYFIPYDFDNDLGTSFFFSNTGTQDVMKFGPMNNSRPLVYKILTILHFRDKYKAYLRELIDPANDFFDFVKSTARIRKWHNMIKNFVDDNTAETVPLEDKPAYWSNVLFYRILGGNDSGEAPQANWFKTRARFTLPQIDSDKGWAPPVLTKDTELFLKGPFNKWSSNVAYKFSYNNGIYSLEVYLSNNIDYKFRIADKSMDKATNFGAPRQTKNVTIDKPLRLYSEFSDPILVNVELPIEASGTYRFEFNVTAKEKPVLLVTLVEPDTIPIAPLK